MRLYLSSIEIPTPNDLADLLGKPLNGASVALIPNAQDYYSQRARDYKITKRVAALTSLGLKVAVVDLLDYSDAAGIKQALAGYDLVWIMGGNTFCLRYEMRRSGFEKVISGLLADGLVWGGDSAGAIVAGPSIAGIESADIPEFAEKIITEGLKLVPQVVLPHADNPEFKEASQAVRSMHASDNLIELKDSQAVIFNDVNYRIVEAH